MKIVRRHVISLLLLLVLFATPGVLAYYFYMHPAFFTLSTTNKGEFVKPAVALPAGLGKKWQLILWQPTVCDEVCLKQIDKLIRVRLALGRQFYDVDVQVLLAEKVPDIDEASRHLFAEQHIKIKHLPLSLAKTPMIYIADPAHYLILKYAASASPDDIFHDIKCLVKKG